MPSIPMLARFAFPTLTIGVTCLLSSGCDLPRFSATKDFQKTITVNSPTEIVADTFNGSIEVTAGSNNEVEVLAHLVAYADSDALAREKLDSLIPEINTTTEALTIRSTKSKEQGSIMDSVRFELKVPAGWPLKLTTSNGTVKCEGLRGPVLVKTSNGRIQVKEAVGKISLTTSNGSVEVAQSQGTVHVHTSNGRIELQQCTLQGDNELSTSNGAISVGLVPNSPIAITANTSNGSIKCDESSVQISDKSSRHLTGIMTSNESSATSQVKLDLKTSNGSVSIKKNDAPTVSGSEAKSNAL
jgi:DUF4097 and DUF4098 domain-containing protein YvlB